MFIFIKDVIPVALEHQRRWLQFSAGVRPHWVALDGHQLRSLQVFQHLEQFEPQQVVVNRTHQVQLG